MELRVQADRTSTVDDGTSAPQSMQNQLSFLHDEGRSRIFSSFGGRDKSNDSLTALANGVRLIYCFAAKGNQRRSFVVVLEKRRRFSAQPILRSN